jgi:hypothetical protein
VRARPWRRMWNGKTFPLSPSTENNLKAALLKGQTHKVLKLQNNLKIIENAKNVQNKKCANRISIDMELLMQKKCVAHHSA